MRALGPGPALVLAQIAEAPPEAREPELAVLCAATPARTPALVIPHLDREWVAALHAALRHAAPVLHSSKVLQRLFIGHGLSPIPVGLDALLASYLLDPGSNRHGPADLAQQAAIPVGPAAAQVPARGTEAAIAQAALIARVAPDLARRVESAGMAEHLRAVETPLAAVLARMEHAGMPVDPEVLADLASELADEAALVACALHEELGFWFNVGSPKQVGEVLFDRLGLEPVRRTQKSGSRSTDSAVLEKLSASHPAPEKILAWRNIMKLKGTYADSLPALVCPETGRIHTTLHQAVAATGRLSSSDPNLQNIPVRTEVGRRIRRAFRAPRGRGFLSVDYSQIDLRVLAHLSRDPGLCAAFREGADIHTQTAAMLFEISPDQVTKDQRRQAKAVNFGIIYGMGPQRLSRELHIAMKEARALIDRYFARFARVRGFFDEVLEGARARGFVETLLGRRRNLPILQKAHGRGAEVRAAERMAMNTPVQGGSADILRLAMLAVDAVLSARFPDCVAVLQIHDELLFEGPWERLEELQAAVTPIMEGVIELAVPLVVHPSLGQTWADV